MLHPWQFSLAIHFLHHFKGMRSTQANLGGKPHFPLVPFESSTHSRGGPILSSSSFSIN